MARPGAPRGSLHVGRYFAVLTGVLILLYTVIFLAGPGSTPLTPKLGLDLQGGASVILQPKTTPKQDQLDTAIDIINRRVNGLGVAEAEVVTQGNNIVVSVPGGSRDSIRSLATTAQLRFREVLEAVPGSGAVQPTANPSAPSVTTTLQPQASKAPAPAPTANGRPVSAGLLAATPSPTPKPTAKPSPSASPGAGGVRTGDKYTPAAFAALDCNN